MWFRVRGTQGIHFLEYDRSIASKRPHSCLGHWFLTEPLVHSVGFTVLPAQSWDLKSELWVSSRAHLWVGLGEPVFTSYYVILLGQVMLINPEVY